MILKNILSRKKAYGWLFAELVVIGVLCWLGIELIAIPINDVLQINNSSGRQLDNHLVITLDTKEVNFPIENAFPHSKVQQNISDIEKQLQKMPEIEYTCSNYHDEIYSKEVASQADTSKWSTACHKGIDKGEDFFEVQQCKVLAGDPVLAKEIPENGIENFVISRSLANFLFNTTDCIGEMVISRMEINGDEVYYKYRHGRVCAVVENDFAMSNGVDEMIYYYKNDEDYQVAYLTTKYIRAYIDVRLKPSADEDEFIEKIQPYIENKSLHSEIFTASKIYKQKELFIEMFKKRNAGTYQMITLLSVIYALVFILNLFVGVSGTFWLQTRKRSEDIAAMRAFGATRLRIIGMLLGEGLVITTTAFAVSILVIFQFIGSAGLQRIDNDATLSNFSHWYSHFGIHFTVISVITWLVLALTVSIGIIIPALKETRKQITDALK